MEHGPGIYGENLGGPEIELAAIPFLTTIAPMLSTTPLRYPGGKGKLTEFLKLVFEENELLDGHYVEPYAGGAGIALNLLMLQYASCIHLNDLDPAVFSFWHSILNEPEEFCRRIGSAKLNMKEWAKQKAVQGDKENHSTLDIGFSTFYLNRTNRSGILTGGVIGGKSQKGEWKIDARFNKLELCRRVQKIALYRSRIRIYDLDAAKLISDILPSLPKKTLVYLDPPYYENADRLYRNHYKHEDHLAIAGLVRAKIKLPWIVSYDNVPEICKMYRGLPTIKYGMNYSAAESYQGREVMFFSEKLAIPRVVNPSKLRAA